MKTLIIFPSKDGARNFYYDTLYEYVQDKIYKEDRNKFYGRDFEIHIAEFKQLESDLRGTIYDKIFVSDFIGRVQFNHILNIVNQNRHKIIFV